MTPVSLQRARGFTLIEMAVVIAVIALLLSSILVPLATQVEERRIADTRRTLDDAREALLGFLIANARLPCPASPTSSGVESPVGGGTCANAHDGFLPAATLGLTPTDDAGFLVDPWGNRIRYAVTAANGTAFTTSQGISNQFLITLPTPDLQVRSTRIAPSCAAGGALTTSTPAVIYSTGPNGQTGGTSADELENNNNDAVFVSGTPSAVGAPCGAFDDIVTWLSPHVLYSRMVAAGKLP